MKALKIWMFCLSFFGILSVTTSCRNEARHFGKADFLYKEGSEKRHQKQSEVAAELFSQALLEIEKCDAGKEDVLRLKGKIEDDLGVMYWIHNMNEEALPLHEDALTIFRKTNDSVSLAQALRNCGRASASLQMLPEAQNYYEEALQIAQAVEKDSL
ncbi:MAG: tetratricopeptide repeat protein, partial [bacterium]|nr:tetratricopeptide repeat protein [Candidatus Limimorpha equi]